MKIWTEDEVEYLKKNYPSNVPMEEICKKLSRTFDSVHSKIKSCFLKRNKELMKQEKKLPFDVDWNNVDECSFYVEKHKSALKNKLYTTLNI